MPVCRRSPWAVSLSGLLVACGVETGGDGTGGSTSAAPSFSAINSKILEPSCTKPCHSGGDFAAGGLDLGIDPYGVLLNQAVTGNVCAGSPMPRVSPGDPDNSLLYRKIVAKSDGTLAPCGEPMPPGADTVALTTEQAEMVRRWIADGAVNTP